MTMTYTSGRSLLSGHKIHCCELNIITKSISCSHILPYLLTNNKPLLTCSEGGFFKAHLIFPKDYPLRPPKMKFITEVWHPNGKDKLSTRSC